MAYNQWNLVAIKLDGTGTHKMRRENTNKL
jgi:hypothetical protein